MTALARPPGAALHVLVPGDPETRTGGYGYVRRISAALGARGWAVHAHRLDDSFPAPTPGALASAADTLAALPDGALVLVDGLAFGAMPGVAAAARDRLRLIALVHHPLAAETGIGAARASELHDSERAALASARAVVVTGAATARALAAYDVPPGHIAVVEPGTDPAPLARGGAAPGVHLLCVATLTPRKGHLALLDALATVAAREWVLTLAGSTVRDPACTEAIAARIRALDLDQRVTVAGEVGPAALDALYDRADAFVLATRMEGYGMALAEALARGLPVVATRAGAVRDTVPPDAGLLVPVDDTEALAGALGRLVGDAALRARLAAGARRARRGLRGWDVAAQRLAAVLEGLAG